MNIILFGPPGVGKSTLIGALKTAGHRAIDLEDVYPSGIRFQLPNLVDNVFLGAADLSPKRNYPSAVKVLLYMPQDKYEERRSNRDALQPGKANQTSQKVDDWLQETQFQAVLRVDRPISAVVKALNKMALLYFKSSK
jgi:ABC-type cobalamin/Fe3+-siderophores transport system ATPase subunit